MDCHQVQAENIIERYVAQALDDESRDAFEAHYFDCQECLEKLRACQALQAELLDNAEAAKIARTPRELPRWTVPLALAATVALAGILSWSLYFKPAEQAVLEELAEFDPPMYTPSTLRQVPGEAQQRFQVAMQSYADGDWPAVVPQLEAAERMDPDAANIHFFLGAALLLDGRHEEAITAFIETIAIGDTPYLEEAHFYLAKSYLSIADLDSARDELRTVASMGGRWSGEARRLIGELDGLEDRLKLRP